MAGNGNRDGLSALGAIAAGCAAAAAAMLAPLGDPERLAIAAAAGIVVALTVVAGVLIGRRIAARPPREEEPAEESEALTLRREDIHPDAPPRRPIFAVSDLGAPEPAEETIPALLERFEQGLARRAARTRPEPRQADAPAADDEAPAPDIDDALRDALGTLKQMASRVQ